MNEITDVTRYDILEIIKNGIDGVEKIDYYGKLNEFDFFERIYELKKLPSYDSRYCNAAGDIKCHLHFGDYEDFWFFDDPRFSLKNGDGDETLLIFLCEMFHPAVRKENSSWRQYVQKFNELLKPDGYELYVESEISERGIYKARRLVHSDFVFSEKIMFSERYKELIVSNGTELIDKITNNLSYITIKKICETILDFREPITLYPDRYNPNYTVSSDAFKLAYFRLYRYLHYSDAYIQGKVVMDSTVETLSRTFTPYLMDLIELQYDELTDDEKSEFLNEINFLFENEGLNFELKEIGIIEVKRVCDVIDDSILHEIQKNKEPVLKELLDLAIQKHKAPDIQSHKEAVEKIWDAFERLKTFYKDLDKKRSSEKIVKTMSNDNDEFYRLFNDEFVALTEIGNKFTIRHYETSKIDIIDSKYYDYLFNRCLSLIALAIQYLPDEGSEEDGL